MTREQEGSRRKSADKKKNNEPKISKISLQGERVGTKELSHSVLSGEVPQMENTTTEQPEGEQDESIGYMQRYLRKHNPEWDEIDIQNEAEYLLSRDPVFRRLIERTVASDKEAKKINPSWKGLDE